MIVLAVGMSTPLGITHVRAIVLIIGTLTLMAFAVLASRRAGYLGRGLVIAAVTGGLIGLIVISVQVVLKAK